MKNNISIHDVIASSDLWMSFNSSTNLEVWLMNKPSIALQTDHKHFSSDIINGALVTNKYDEIESYIAEYYDTGKILDFEEKHELQKSLIKQYIGFHDGFNHVRHAEIILEFLKKNKKN